MIDMTHFWTTAALVLVSMDPVDEDLGLGDRDKVVLLTDAGVASQAVCGLTNDVFC